MHNPQVFGYLGDIESSGIKTISRQFTKQDGQKGVGIWRQPHTIKPLPL
jgi:hypothetical protein